jgi:transketolase
VAELSVEQLKAQALVIRRDIIKMTTAANSGHPTSSLSAADVVTALYFGGFMKYDPKNPKDPGRDRFILSKGHACPVLYAAMAHAGYFPIEETMTLRKLGSPYEGHPNVRRLPGIEAVGHALAARLDNLNFNVFCMLGDGEMGEGQVWEAIASADKYKLGNLTAIIDQNGYQQTGATKDVLSLREFQPKLEAFGWYVQTINGNDMGEVVAALKQAATVTDRPKCIVSQTQKGFGILPLLKEEGDLNYHGKPIPKALEEKALALLT